MIKFLVLGHNPVLANFVYMYLAILLSQKKPNTIQEKILTMLCLRILCTAGRKTSNTSLL